MCKEVVYNIQIFFQKGKENGQHTIIHQPKNDFRGTFLFHIVKSFLFYKHKYIYLSVRMHNLTANLFSLRFL